jgi:hypothetical protein
VAPMQAIQLWLSESKENSSSLKVKMDGIGPLTVSKKHLTPNGSNGLRTLISTFATCHSLLLLKPNGTILQLLLSSSRL